MNGLATMNLFLVFGSSLVTLVLFVSLVYALIKPLPELPQGKKPFVVYMIGLFYFFIAVLFPLKLFAVGLMGGSNPFSTWAALPKSAVAMSLISMVFNVAAPLSLFLMRRISLVLFGAVFLMSVYTYRFVFVNIGSLSISHSYLLLGLLQPLLITAYVYKLFKNGKLS